jgi:hypothetical protein
VSGGIHGVECRLELRVRPKTAHRPVVANDSDGGLTGALDTSHYDQVRTQVSLSD